jgi:hypothetical protein
MKNLLYKSFVALATVAGICPALLAQNPLATANIIYEGGQMGIHHYVSIRFWVYPLDTSTEAAGLFDSYSFSPADVGRTFVITQAEDPDFNNAVSWLTDGVSEEVSYDVMTYPEGGGGGQILSEANMFSPLPVGANGIDLAGFNIDNFTLRIDQVILNSPGMDPNSDGNWTDVYVAAVLLVNGTPVPEPGSVALAALALGCAWLGARRTAARAR